MASRRRAPTIATALLLALSSCGGELAVAEPSGNDAGADGPAEAALDADAGRCIACTDTVEQYCAQKSCPPAWGSREYLDWCPMQSCYIFAYDCGSFISLETECGGTCGRSWFFDKTDGHLFGYLVSNYYQPDVYCAGESAIVCAAREHLNCREIDECPVPDAGCH